MSTAVEPLKNARTAPQPVFLRGLRARLEWAKACGVFDDEYRLHFQADAMREAWVQGHTDMQMQRCYTDVPPLLADVPELARQWDEGWMFAHEVEAIQQCDECKRANGDPCSVHG